MTTAAALSGSETSSEKPSLRTVDLRGPAGRLEALLNEGAADSQFVGLVCHPHPIGGGTMHNKVVYHAMKVLNAPEWGLRWPVLRFNFRGTGLSEGQHDGRAESADVSAALDWLQAEYKLPVVLLGFSFGAAMAIAASCGTDSDNNREKQVSAHWLPWDCRPRDSAIPTDIPRSRNARCPSSSSAAMATRLLRSRTCCRWFDTAADPKNLVLVPGADHFFTGQLDRMQRSLASWLKEQVQ